MRKPLNVMKIRPCQFLRSDPISNTFGMVRTKHGKRKAHQGWDLDAAPGTPTFAIADGEIKAGISSTYGNWLSLKFSHKRKTYFAYYAHLSTYATVRQLQAVKEGDLIAFTGRSGNAGTIPLSESHLHFEVRTTEFPLGHKAPLTGRVDPGEIFGYEIYSSHV